MEWGKKHLALPNLTLELTGKIEQYLAWLLEQSADRMGIAEERRIFNTAVNIAKGKRFPCDVGIVNGERSFNYVAAKSAFDYCNRQE